MKYVALFWLKFGHSLVPCGEAVKVLPVTVAKKVKKKVDSIRYYKIHSLQVFVRLVILLTWYDIVFCSEHVGLQQNVHVVLNDC